MPESFTSVTIYAYLNSSWVELDVHQPSLVTANWGMSGGLPLDRLANTGTMYFALNNNSKQYSPNSPSALSGWGFGVPVKIVFSYDGVDYVRFRGYVTAIDIDPGVKLTRLARITALDWMDYAVNHPVVTPDFSQNKTADQGIQLLIDNMPIPPQNTDFDTGVFNFLSIFDTTTTRTKAYSEFSKFAMSEFGYIYLRRDRANGETLVFENNSARSGLKSLTPIPLSNANSGFALNEDGGYELNEDGSKVLLNQTETFALDNSMVDLSPSYGQNIVNYVTARAYPKRIDTSLHVLFTLSSPILLGKGVTEIFRASYSDPTGGAEVNAIPNTCVQPVITTDYLMYSNSDGTGTNLSANLTISAVYGVEGVTYTLYNSSDSGYVTFLQARGYGVYSYNPVERSVSSSSSYDLYGYRTMDIEQILQQSVLLGKQEAEKIVDLEKNPRTVPDSITLIANTSVSNMMAFLNLDIGDLIGPIEEDQTGISGYYYINGASFTVEEGQNVSFEFKLREAFSIDSGLSFVDLEGASTTDGINYGYLPRVVNLNQKSYSAWIINKSGGAGVGERVIMGTFVGISLGNTGSKIFLSGTSPSLLTYINGGDSNTHYGQWEESGTDLQYGYHHIVVTRDASSVNNVPNMYIDGVLQTINTVQSQTGTFSESGYSFILGNQLDYNSVFDAVIRDARVYNRILSPTEVTTLYANGVYDMSITDGLVFQGPLVRSVELSDYINATLNSEMKVLESSNGFVGTPNGSPVMRYGLGNVYGASAVASSVTWTHIATNGQNKILVVAVAMRATETVTGVTFGGLALTKNNHRAWGTGSSDPRVELWYLLSPAVGAGTIVVTASAATEFSVSSIDFSGISQSTPFGTLSSSTGTSIFPSVTVTSATNEIVIDVLGIAANTIQPGTSLAKLWEQTADGSWRGAGGMKNGAASVTMDWVLSGSTKWAILAVPLKRA